LVNSLSGVPDISELNTFVQGVLGTTDGEQKQ